MDAMVPSASNAIAAATVPQAAGRNAIGGAGWIRCRGERSGHVATKRQMDGMRNIAAKRRLKRALANRLAAQNEKGARIKRTPSPEHELNAIQQRSLQPQQQQLLQQPLLLRLLQQQQQPQPLQQP